MIRNLAVAGGRPPKNEDFTLYIQAFTILESLFAELNTGSFILTGFNSTGAGPFFLTSGIVYHNGELCIYDGGDSYSGGDLVFKKERVQQNPREFQDDVTRNTSEVVKLLVDPTGDFTFNGDTTRAPDRFLRNVNGVLKAPIDANNNGVFNIWKSLLSDRAELSRVIPKPNINTFLKLGTFPIGETKSFSFLVEGVAANATAPVLLNIQRRFFTGFDDVVGTATYMGDTGLVSGGELFFLIRNDTQSVYELWIKSPTTDGGGTLTNAVITQISESFTDDSEAGFTFQKTFSWGLIPSGSKYYVPRRVYADKSDSDNIMRKRLEIGGWNMTGLFTKTVAHGIGGSNTIVGINVLINTDEGSGSVVFGGSITLPTGGETGIISVDSTNVNLQISSNSIFNFELYDNHSINRGYIVIDYI